MKTCSSCKIEKTPGEFHAKRTGRFGVSGTCKTCSSEKNKAYNAANKDSLAEKSAIRRAKDGAREVANERERLRYQREGEKIRARNREYYADNRESRSEYNRKWREENANYLAEYEANRSDAAYLKNFAYRLNNPEKWRGIMAAAAARRRSSEIKATPAWANRKAINDVYRACQLITTLSGTRHHVDHVIPLVSPLVCGLHVEYNLQILPAAKNLSKSNKFEVLTLCHSSSASCPTA